MNNNLPQTVKDNIFTKIRKWFFKFIPNNKQKNVVESESITKENNENTFKEKIQISDAMALQRKLTERQMEIQELTDEELDEVIKLYEEQIEEQKATLKRYREIIYSNKRSS